MNNQGDFLISDFIELKRDELQRNKNQVRLHEKSIPGVSHPEDSPWFINIQHLLKHQFHIIDNHVNYSQLTMNLTIIKLNIYI